MEEIEAHIKILDDEIQTIEKNKDAQNNESEVNVTNIKICKLL